MAATLLVVVVAAVLLGGNEVRSQDFMRLSLSKNSPLKLLVHLKPNTESEAVCYLNTTSILQLKKGGVAAPIPVTRDGVYWCSDFLGRVSNFVSVFRNGTHAFFVSYAARTIQPPAACDFNLTKWSREHSGNSGVPRGSTVLIIRDPIQHSRVCAEEVLICPNNTDHGLLHSPDYWNNNWPDRCQHEQIRTSTTWTPTSPGSTRDSTTTAFLLTETSSQMAHIKTNLSETATSLHNISSKPVVTATDLGIATELVSKALQVNFTLLSSDRQNVKTIVRGLDDVLKKVRLSSGGQVQNVTSKVAVFVVNVEDKRSQGITLAGSKSYGDLQGVSLTSAASYNQVVSSDVEVGVWLPESLAARTSHLAFSLFSDDAAFRDPARPDARTNSHIVGVNVVSNFSLSGADYVDIVFKPRGEAGARQCVFWDFGLDGGGWSTEGCALQPGATHDVCRCTHLTHFAELITPPGVAVDPVHGDVLDIISIVGCSLSLLGLLGIFVTGAAFKQWRAQLGNKILLQLSGALALNMAAFLVAGAGLAHAPAACVAAGALLHYSVLASFCWMLVSAALQFLRLVSVLGGHRVSHLLLKSCLFAWGAPLLPVCSLLAVDPGLYHGVERGFCYPEGLAFYLAVLAPVLLVVSVNVMIFGTILYRVFEGGSVKRHVRAERTLAMRRVATSVLLFFLLGLSWVFGLLCNLGYLSIVFAYLFCITSTVQGFVLFLFFILGEKKSRSYWVSSATKTNLTSTTATPTERIALNRQSE